MSDSNEKEVLDMVVALLSVTPAERGSRLRALCGSDEVRARVVSVLRGLSEPVEKSEQVEKSEPVERIDQERGSRTFPISDDADNSQLADSFPKRIGAYTLLRRIGAGGMGQVFEAEQDKPRRRVALKLIHPHRMNRAMLRRFEYEAEFLGRLDHVGIARIYEAGSADSASGRQPFLAMELVDGPRLDEWARREALDLSRTIQMVIAIGDAITHAHQKGLIHRDLKPANILVVAGDQPKILDFGLARPLEDAAPLMTLATSEGQLLGTLQYMSPEQATGNIAELDTRTDVYALGVIAYELLGGKLPYDLKDKSFPEALDAIRSNEAPLLGTIDRRLSGDLETIVAKALSKQKSQRYDSAADFANDLRNSLAHRPILARAPSRMDLFRRFARRHVALLTASAAVALALVAGVIGTSWGMVRAQHARDQESAQRIRAEQANQIKDQVNDWVRDVLLAPDPANAQGREVTVKEVLDKAADGIDSTFQNEPMIAASLHGFVGSTYEGLGLAEKSLRHFERECALLEMNAGSDALTTLQARANLAEPLYSLGRNDEAQRVLRDVIQRMNRVLGPDAQDTLVATGKLARNLQDSGKSSEALPILRDLLERERRVLGPDHESTLITASNLGWVLNALGKPGDAEPIDRFLLEQRKHVSGADHPETLAAQNNLARCLQDQGKLGEAEPLMRDLVERCKRVKGENHQHTLLAQNNLADMTVDLGRPAEAEPLYRDAYERLSKALGPDHPITLQAGGNLGACLSMLGKLSEAEPLQRRVVDGLERVRGPDHPATLGARSNLAQVLVKLNQADEACAILEEVVGRIRKLYGDHHARTLSCMNAYVQALQKAHRQEEAKQMYDALMKACDSPEVQIPAARISAYRSGFVAGPATGPTGATQPVGGANTGTHPE